MQTGGQGPAGDRTVEQVRWVGFAVGFVIAQGVALRWAWRQPPGRRRRFALHAAFSGVLAVAEPVIWVFSGGGFFWPVFAWGVLGLLVAVHGWLLAYPPGRREQELTRRVERLSRTRRSALDTQAQELRRIERDLHDGAQARLVSLAMTIGLAESLLHRDPGSAAELLAEARAGTQTALAELRAVMQSVHPPVLADRGLHGALEALALDLAVPVEVHSDLRGIAPPAVESALYFAVVAAVDSPGALAAALRDDQVDVAVVDVRLPPTFTNEGLVAAVQARRRRPGLPVLVLSQFVEHLYARDCWPRVRAAWATCSRTGWPTWTTSSRRCGEWPESAPRYEYGKLVI